MLRCQDLWGISKKVIDTIHIEHNEKTQKEIADAEKKLKGIDSFFNQMIVAGGLGVILIIIGIIVLVVIF